jgi:Arc/MetJ-type ribon-helix-helix transcriptional regulator
MDSVRVNILLPEKLLKESKSLVEQGYFSNFSEVVRDSLRREIINYKSGLGELTDKDRQLLEWARQEESLGNVLTEKDMQKHGLKV